MNDIPNRQIICDVLMEQAEKDRNVVVLCSDSRNSGSLSQFAEKYPKQFIEIGIAEQNLVSVASGLASCGKKVFAVSPACFLSTRSMEQARVDVAYSNKNVKLIGISGGISYGSLGMTHHSTQDIAIMGSIPNMRVYLPSDRWQTKSLIEYVLLDDKPAYIRVGRNAVEDVYSKDDLSFKMDFATEISSGKDVTIIACGEMLKYAKEAVLLLSKEKISAKLLDMYCIKPLDVNSIIKAANETKLIITIEEHSIIGGLGSLVSQVVSKNCPKKVISLALPDNSLITGNSKQLFTHYGLTAENIVKMAIENL